MAKVLVVHDDSVISRVAWLIEQRKEKIRTVSYVHVGDKLVNTKDLTEEQRVKVATWLKVTYLNALFRGKAEFYVTSDGETHGKCCNQGDLALE